MRQFNWFIVHLVIGFWLVISPYILGFTDSPTAYWQSLGAGIVLVVSSALALYYSGGELAGGPMSHQAHRA